MIVIFKPNAPQEKIDALIGRLEDMGFSHHFSRGTETTLVGLIGDTTKVDIDSLRANDIVADVKRVSEPYKAANRKFHPQDTVVTVKGRSIGGGNFGVIAGPCSVESHSQMLEVAQQVQACGAGLLRGGAFKPRTSPYAFQGLHAQGLDFLLEAGRRTGLPAVSYTHLAANAQAGTACGPQLRIPCKVSDQKTFIHALLRLFSRLLRSRLRLFSRFGLLSGFLHAHDDVAHHVFINVVIALQLLNELGIGLEGHQDRISVVLEVDGVGQTALTPVLHLSLIHT